MTAALVRAVPVVPVSDGGYRVTFFAPTGA